MYRVWKQGDRLPKAFPAPTHDRANNKLRPTFSAGAGTVASPQVGCTAKNRPYRAEDGN